MDEALTRMPFSSRNNSTGDPADFSLVLGGPLYQFFLRARMLKPPLDLCYRRIVVITLVAWLPLLLLAVFGGAAENVKVPFLLDLDTHVRFLGSVPLLIAAELLVHQRMRLTVGQFIERGIIASHELPRFEGIIASVLRLRNSVVAEVLLVVLVFTAGHWIWREHIRLDVVTWYASQSDGGLQLTPAGIWYAYVSLPLVRFIALRWWFRWCLWCLFLFRVSRLSLCLNALHPDRAGGLGFLTGSVFAFAPVLIAHTVLLSGVIGNQIWHSGAKLTDFKLEMVGFVTGLMLLALAPLSMFVFHLADSKRKGLQEYGVLASRYVRDFRVKWMDLVGVNSVSDQGDATGSLPANAGHAATEPILGAADIQSLADLSGSFEIVREMSLLPISRQSVVQLAALVCLPLLPLTLTMIPLEDMIDRMVGVLF